MTSCAYASMAATCERRVGEGLRRAAHKRQIVLDLVHRVNAQLARTVLG